MTDKEKTGPIVPPMQSDPDLKDYYCPHCSRFLFKGNVKKLNMVCHHCQKFITADGNDLMKPEDEQEV